MAATKYRFSRNDFQPLITRPLHMDMVFDISPTKVGVIMHATYHHGGTEPLEEVVLNSKGLEILKVARIESFTPLADKNFTEHVSSFGEAVEECFQVDCENHFLKIKLVTAIPPNGQFVLQTSSVATPTKNILEGLYFDYTPEGAPQTIITQCQQYGFQRIVPCIDTMDAKCFYTTTIVADKKYTNMITNGDLAPGFVDEATGLPVYHPVEDVSGMAADESRHVLKYVNHKVCMAPYLFFLGVGTYVTYRQTLEFPDGDKTLLELLAIEGRATDDDAKAAVKMLHDSIQWVMVSLGPEATQHCTERAQIYKLLAEREELKAKNRPAVTSSSEVVSETPFSDEDSTRLEAVRAELKTLIGVWNKTGYKYTGAIYREIAMENSYYGGMENVGNTTIVSSCLCPSCSMGDTSYEYMERVKVHEYYHNINGSQVTGQSPFEIWLNEAVTVHMERKRYASLFGANYTRLHEVTYMFRPALGPLAQDKSPTSLSVEPEGFNQTQELVSVVTYSKAPEFVRMVELILGNKAFDEALDLYHTRYSFGNATSSQWIACMEESSGKDLQMLAKTWLKRPGFPTVSYSSEYNAETKVYSVSMSQAGFKENKPEDNCGPWDIPIDWALIKEGAVVTSGVYRLTEAESVLTIENVETEPDYISFARGYSFFGVSESKSATTAQLSVQARTDPDPVNRYFAYRAVAEREKARIIESLMKDASAEVIVSPEYVELHALLLFDDAISPSTRALTLSEPNSTSRDDLSHRYVEINTARKAMLSAVWKSHGEKISEMYSKLTAECVEGSIKDQLHERALKALVLNLMAKGKASDLPTLAKNQLTTSPFMTDKCVALRALLESDDFTDSREGLQTEIFNEWKANPSKLEAYISIITSLDNDKIVDAEIRKLMECPEFDVTLSHHSRTLTRGLSQIRHFSVATEAGRSLMVDAFLKIGKVNQMSAYPILKSFDGIDSFDEAKQAEMNATLEKMQSGIDKVHQESLFNQLNIMLKKV